MPILATAIPSKSAAIKAGETWKGLDNLDLLLVLDMNVLWRQPRLIPLDDRRISSLQITRKASAIEQRSAQPVVL